MNSLVLFLHQLCFSLSAADQLLEFRIPFPSTVEQFRVGQLYTVARSEVIKAQHGLNIEIVANTPYAGKDRSGHYSGHGQYTHKVFDITNYRYLPSFIRLLAPTGSLELSETAWNAYPRTYTEYSNAYMGVNFHVIVLSLYKKGDCKEDNIFGMNSTELSSRTVIPIDITKSLRSRYYDVNEDPAFIRSDKLGIGPLESDWKSEAKNMMCVYKKINIKIKWFGLQTKLESIVKKRITAEIRKFFQRGFCWADQWFDMTMTDTRNLEADTKKTLDELSKAQDQPGLFQKTKK